MNNNGWIKISRELPNHWLWQDAGRLKWWLDLLLMAQWEDKKVIHDTHVFTLKRGQMIASVSFLVKRWERSKPTVLAFLKLLEDEGMIRRETLYRQTPILTICNYESYQSGVDTMLDTMLDPLIEPKRDENLDPLIDTIADRQNQDVTSCNTASSNNSKDVELDPLIDKALDTIVDSQIDPMLYPNKEYKECKNSRYIKDNTYNHNNSDEYCSCSVTEKNDQKIFSDDPEIHVEEISSRIGTSPDAELPLIEEKKEKEKNSGKKKKKKRPRFIPPTLQDVAAYIAEKGYMVNAERFVSYYESNGWKVGRNSMVDWKAAVRTWNAKEKQMTTINRSYEKNQTTESDFERRQREFHEHIGAKLARNRASRKDSGTSN